MNNIRLNDLSDEKISELLKGLDDDIQVPLDVSAAWRRAVRKEAASIRFLPRLRRWGEMAAAIVLMVGLTFLWRGALKPQAHGDQAGPAQSEKYIYILQEEGAAMTLLASDSSLAETSDTDDTDIEETLTRSTADEDVLPKEESADVKMMLAAKADTGAYGLSPEIVKYAYADLSVKDPGETHSQMHALVKNYDAYIESEEYAQDDDSSISGRIRVRADQFEEMADALKNRFKGIELNVFEEDISTLYRDGSERLEAAYRAIEELTRRLETVPEAEIAALYDQINRMYDDIDLFRGEQNAYLADTQYSTVFYTIRQRAALGSFAAFFRPSETGGLAGFALDFVKVALVLLPVIALTAYIAIRHANMAQRKKLYRQPA
ncbi:MAG: DUF4349 domain-containing protein [Clostridia bacterium]|nr:DUF4349 domain-containing protein [Clostridia bacterium]